MEYPQRFIKARNWWLVGTMKRDIRGIMLHSTRSGVVNPSDYDDGPGTENYASSPNNLAAYWDMLTWRTGQRIKSTYWENDEFPQWCAGQGNAGTWPAHQYYLQHEIAQCRVDQPFSKDSILSVAEWTAVQCLTYNFKPERIDFLSQVGDAPRGICTHQGSANGVKLGKSDVGYMFPWDDFLGRVNEILEDVGMTPQEVEDICNRVIAAKVSEGSLVDSGQIPEKVAQLVGAIPSTYTSPEDLKLQDAIRGVINAGGSHHHDFSAGTTTGPIA